MTWFLLTSSLTGWSSVTVSFHWLSNKAAWHCSGGVSQTGKLVYFIWLLLLSFPAKWLPNIFLSYWLRGEKSHKQWSVWTKGYIFFTALYKETFMKWYDFLSLNTLFQLYLDKYKSFRSVRNWFERQLGSSVCGNLSPCPKATSPTSFCNKLDLSHNWKSLQPFTKPVPEEQPSVTCVR